MNGMIDSTKEINVWHKPIDGASEYELFENGAIWSRIRNKWLKPHANDKEGHLQIRFINDKGKKVHEMLHRLVYMNFVKPIPKGFVIHHIDQDPSNNHYTNLKMMTKQEHISLHHKGKIVSEQTRKKQSKANIGNKKSLGIKRSEQCKRNKSEAMKKFYETHDSPKKGKKMSQQSRKKMSESHKGLKQSKETLLKRSNAMKGKKHSYQTRRKMSQNSKKRLRVNGKFIKQ